MKKRLSKLLHHSYHLLPKNSEKIDIVHITLLIEWNCMNIDELMRIKDGHQNSYAPFFNVIVGNPPYQKDTGNGAVAIYHHIMNIAQELGKNISMIYPARWTNAGRGEGLEQFRNNELNSKHYRKFIINSHDSGIFEDATIKGGVNYFLWNYEITEKVLYIFNQMKQSRTTLLNNDPMMIVDPRFSEIVHKVSPNNYIKICSRNHYGSHLETDYKIEKLAAEKTADDTGTRIFYSSMKGGIHTAIIPKKSSKHNDEGYKTIASRTADPDKRNNTLRRQNRLFIIKPGEIVSGSFLQIQKFDTHEEAYNCAKYLRTEFAMFLLGIITHAQSTVRNNYKLIPNLDFKTGEIKDKPGVFLNFNNMESLNEQLFNIYELTTDERNLILNSVKPWKDDSSIDIENLVNL